MSFSRRGLSSLPVQLILVAGLYGQAAPQTPSTSTSPSTTPAPAAAQTPAPAKPSAAQSPNAVPRDTSLDLKKRNYLRLLSVGVSLSVLGQVPLKDGSFSDTLTNQTRDASTTAGGYRIGYGGMLQLRLPKKFAFAVSVAQHKSAHSSTLDQYDGIDNPNTPLDDRKHTTINENSITKYWDYTFMGRWYTKEHTKAGHRAFFEGGVNMRQVKSVRTERETTIIETVADTKPISPTNTWSRGLTGGVGAQFTDDFGVKLVPEFRYTRWVQPAWDTLSTTSRKNQFEAVVSITF
jgi:hypothetical protein